MSGETFRLEWRRASSVASPYRAVAAFVAADCGRVADEAVLRCREALDGEFRLFRAGSSVGRVVYTRARELARWSSGGDDVPEAAGRSRWLSEIREATRAAKASSDVMSALTEAVQSGAVRKIDAARLFDAFESSLRSHAAAQSA